jgi:hypothetical protein
MEAQHVKEQAMRNEADAARQRQEIDRRNKIRAAAVLLRQQAKTTAKESAALARSIAEIKDVCGANLLELQAEVDTERARKNELTATLKKLRALAGIAG